MNKITDVFFDLDHTLWDFDRNSELAFQKIFKLNHLQINLNDFLEVYKPINLEFWKLYREDVIDKETLRYKRLRKTFDSLDVVVKDEMIYKLSEDYITYLTSYNYLFNDTIQVLDYLNKKYSLHIITNGFRKIQQKKLRKSKINHYFDTVTDSESVGLKKPNYQVFEYALKHANAKPNESIMIGDSLEADIIGADNYGLNTIWITRSTSEKSCKFKKIKHLIELNGIL